MKDLSTARKITLALTLFTAFSVASLTASAQNSKLIAINLVREAMTAYGNLDVDTAKAKLDAALSMGTQLDAGTLARVHVSYGVIWVGGLGDNARGQESFLTARCLDPAVQIDPLYSSPEIEMIFTLAKGQANPSTCAQRTAGVMAAAPVAVAVAPLPQPIPQPMPQPMNTAPSGWGAAVPVCGMHSPVSMQKKSTEVPLAVQIDVNLAPKIARLSIRYAFDGGTTFFDLALGKAGNGWATGMISCADGQISNFDPSRIAYFIEGYDASGILICSNGSAQTPFVVTMDPAASVVQGVPGSPEPQTCGECPPWNQDCHKGAAGAGAPCFSNEECSNGQKCGDSGFCEGGEGGAKDEKTDDSTNGGPKHVYFNITGGTGGGFTTSSDAYIAAEALDVNNFGGADDLWAAPYNKVSAGGWSGVPLRFQLGFNIKPRFALEVGMRIDFRALYKKQKQPYYCNSTYPRDDVTAEWQTNYGVNLSCSHGSDSEYYGVLYWIPDGTIWVASEEKNAPGFKDAFLINLRARYRFVMDNKLQVSFFGGLGYGHLFYSAKLNDVDFDGVTDEQFSMPGMINVELGPAFAYYFNSHIGFVLEAPIDLVFGESGAFAINGELAVGLSFGG